MRTGLPTGRLSRRRRQPSPCLCPAERLTGDTATEALEDEVDSSGAAGGENEVPDKPESVEMPSQAAEGDGVPYDMECSGAAGEES